jgi:rhodanese-related sulfurtransferase/polyisoprenoid-binding protein YceI
MEIQSDAVRISPQKLNEKLISGKTFALIDTLPNDHFVAAHIPGARNACVFEVVFPGNVEAIVPGKDDEIIVYGSSGRSMDAATAAEKLARAGYGNVSILDGGLAGWQGGGFPVEGTNIDILSVSEEALRPADGDYRADIDESVVEWTGRNPGKKHYGTLPLTRGGLVVKNGSITGSFELDMKGIKTTDLAGDEYEPVLISHLESDDFFFVKLFPKALFNITATSPIDRSTPSSPNLEITGDLELRGNINSIRFPATLTPLPEGGMTIEAHFDIDRTRWQVIYGSARFFEHLGMHLVFDLISIQVHLVLLTG